MSSNDDYRREDDARERSARRGDGSATGNLSIESSASVKPGAASYGQGLDELALASRRRASAYGRARGVI